LDDRVKEADSLEEFLEIDGHVAVHEEIVSGDVGLRIGALWI
jgi:hypothetical protein